MRPHTQGFTLLEAIIYIALLAGMITMLGVYLVSYSSYSTYLDKKILYEMETTRKWFE